MTDIYESAAERDLHAQLMQSLAAETHRDINEVQLVYERAYLDLSGQARVRDFLPLFVTRRARSMLDPRR